LETESRACALSPPVLSLRPVSSLHLRPRSVSTLAPSPPLSIMGSTVAHRKTQ
jgi:hypothetical protein